MCKHLYPGQVESQMEIVICDNEDCDYKFHPQCLRCSFKSCQAHFIQCITGDKVNALLNELQQKCEQLEKQLFNLNQTFNKRITTTLSQSRQILNRIEQFSVDCLLQDLIPINFNIDFIMDILKDLSKDLQNKFFTIDEYINEIQQPLNFYNKKQAKIYQKHSILFDQEYHQDQSLKAINTSINLDSSSLFSIFQKGNLLLKQHQYEESLIYLYKAFLLSKKSKKKELKFQIFITLQENCLFKMKRYNDLIELTNLHEKEFDEKQVSMFKTFAYYNKKQYDLALTSLNQLNIEEIKNQQSTRLKDLCEKAQKNMQDQRLNQSILSEQEILKSSLSNQSSIQPKKDTSQEYQKQGSIIMMFRKALQQLADIVNEDDDEKEAFIRQNPQFILKMTQNQIEIVSYSDANAQGSKTNLTTKIISLQNHR